MKNASLTLHGHAQSVVRTNCFDGKLSKGKGKTIAGGLGHPFTEKDFENVSPENV